MPDSPERRWRGSPRAWPVLQGMLPIERSRVPAEVLAGLTLAALGIPAVLGYAKIAGMPLVTGLYTMLLPMAAALIYAEEAETLALRRTVFWVLQLGLMIDIPNMLQRFGAFTPLSDGAIQILKHADRVLVLVLFGLTLILALKSLRLKADS